MPAKQYAASRTDGVYIGKAIKEVVRLMIEDGMPWQSAADSVTRDLTSEDHARTLLVVRGIAILVVERRVHPSNSAQFPTRSTGPAVAGLARRTGYPTRAGREQPLPW